MRALPDRTVDRRAAATRPFLYRDATPIVDSSGVFGGCGSHLTSKQRHIGHQQHDVSSRLGPYGSEIPVVCALLS
jgi:hypothetical protein